MQSM